MLLRSPGPIRPVKRTDLSSRLVTQASHKRANARAPLANPSSCQPWSALQKPTTHESQKTDSGIPHSSKSAKVVGPVHIRFPTKKPTPYLGSDRALTTSTDELPSPLGPAYTQDSRPRDVTRTVEEYLSKRQELPS